MNNQELLECIAPYLPYGLKVQVYGQTVWETYETDIEHINTNGEVYFSHEWNDINNNEYFKFALRPLSDLIKSITHKGETFVPMTKLVGMEKYKHFFEKFGGLKRKDDWSIIDCWWINTEFDDKPKPYEKFCTWQLDRMSFKDAVKLIKWHFDIFGLIEKGYAIDINTLKI